MASGGMGDLLSGIIGGILAQKIPSEFAIPLAVSLHAEAGDYALKEFGYTGLLATDLLPYVRLLFQNQN